MKMNFHSKLIKSIFTPSFIILLVILLGGCQTGKGVKPADPAAQPATAVIPLEKSYQDIVVFELETSPEIKQDYAEEISECQSTLITSLHMKKKYRKVEPGNDDASYDENSVLLVKIKLSDMRITSSAARIWGGVFAGSSNMYMHMKLVDAVTQEVVREEAFNSTNNAWAAAWNMGASDKSLPSDMGKIMAEYIAKVVPNK